MNAVFDACAMIALLRLEPGALAARQILRANPGQCYAHAVNLLEVYYGFTRVSGMAYAERAVEILTAAGIIIREDMDAGLWKDAGGIKAANRISLADVFCLALARRIGGEVITTDHREFDPLVALGLCPIRFLR